MQWVGPTAWVLSALAVVLGAYWLVVLWRVHRDGRNRPGLAGGMGVALPSWPSVSIIIPAHNEREHAPDLLRSLLMQDYPAPMQIIFVLDRCTDGTRQALEEVARGAPSNRSVELIDNPDCPPDWAGKCNAAHRGSREARGEMLLFTDADTTFAPALVRCAVALFHQRSLALLSALPAVSVRHGFEALVQPVCAMQLMKLYPISRVNSPDRPRPFANGQFLLFSRTSYDDLGGHGAVHGDLLEDLAFARRMVHVLKRPAGLFVSDDLLRVRMYESYGQFREGWKRIFIEACNRNPRRLLRYGIECAGVGAGTTIVGALSITAGAAGIASGTPGSWGVAIAGGVIALLAQHLTLMVIFSLIGVPAVGALCYSVSAIRVAAIQWSAARMLRLRMPVRWGGRHYVLKPQRN